MAHRKQSQASQLTKTKKNKPQNGSHRRDQIDDIIFFLTPLRHRNAIPKRLVNVVILLRSAFPRQSIKKATVKKAFARAKWDASGLCNLTNNQLADAIEAGELDKSFDQPPVRVQPVTFRKPWKDSNTSEPEKIAPQPKTSQQGFPDGYFEETYTAGPKIRHTKAYPSMFYNNIEQEIKRKAKKHPPKVICARSVLVKPQLQREISSNGDKKFEKPATSATAEDTRRIIEAKHHSIHREERVLIRKTQLGVNSILQIMTKLSNKKDMPKKLNRVRNFIRTENPGVKVRTSMIRKAYKRLGWKKTNGQVLKNDDIATSEPIRGNNLVSPEEKLKETTVQHPRTTKFFPRNVKKSRKAVKYATADRVYGTARKHRVMHETAAAAFEEQKKRVAVDKKVSIAMRRLYLRRKNNRTLVA